MEIQSYSELLNIHDPGRTLKAGQAIVGDWLGQVISSAVGQVQDDALPSFSILPCENVLEGSLLNR